MSPTASPSGWLTLAPGSGLGKQAPATQEPVFAEVTVSGGPQGGELRFPGPRPASRKQELGEEGVQEGQLSESWQRGGL